MSSTQAHNVKHTHDILPSTQFYTRNCCIHMAINMTNYVPWLLSSCGKPLGCVSIFSDSMSTLQALDSPDPGPLIQTLKASFTALTQTSPTTLPWVPVYIGHSGNEYANHVAKEGSQLPSQMFLPCMRKQKQFSAATSAEIELP